MTFLNCSPTAAKAQESSLNPGKPQCLQPQCRKAVAELETTAATMRLSDSMSKSAEVICEMVIRMRLEILKQVMKQMNSLVKIPEMEAFACLEGLCGLSS